MSALGHKRTSSRSLDHLVGLREQRGRDRYTERLSRLEIDRQLILGRCLHLKVCRLLALEDANRHRHTSVAHRYGHHELLNFLWARNENQPNAIRLKRNQRTWGPGK